MFIQGISAGVTGQNRNSELGTGLCEIAQEFIFYLLSPALLWVQECLYFNNTDITLVKRQSLAPFFKG